MKKLMLVPVISLSFAMGFAVEDREYNVDDKKARVLTSDKDKMDLKSNQQKLNSFSQQTAPIDTDSSKKAHKKNLNKQDEDSDDDDENPNLRDLAKPEPNIQRNLNMPTDEEQRLNREMMLDDPQGGFQNTGPRGIGNPSQY